MPCLFLLGNKKEKMNRSNSKIQKRNSDSVNTIHSAFLSLSADYSTTHGADIPHTHFADTLYLQHSDQNILQSNLLRFKHDNSYYHGLREIDWNVFVTLKFRAKGYTSISNSASWKRKHYLWELFHEVVSDLDLSSNDLQYFWAEEVNAEREAHYHVLFHRVHAHKCSVEDLRRSIEENIDPKIIQIPKAYEGQEPPHVQTVKSQDRVVRYALKTRLFQKEQKVLGHSHKFFRFWKRHMNWKSRQAA